MLALHALLAIQSPHCHHTCHAYTEGSPPQDFTQGLTVLLFNPYGWNHDIQKATRRDTRCFCFELWLPWSWTKETVWGCRVLGQCLDEDECEVKWEEEHDKGSVVFADAIKELKGFYTKTGQIIATRQDLFPQQYTDRLAGLTDYVDPMDASLVRAVIAQELLHEDESFDDVFAEFDDEPLGAASVAHLLNRTFRPSYVPMDAADVAPVVAALLAGRAQVAHFLRLLA